MKQFLTLQAKSNYKEADYDTVLRVMIVVFCYTNVCLLQFRDFLKQVIGQESKPVVINAAKEILEKCTALLGEIATGIEEEEKRKTIQVTWFSTMK